jgi:hypothetical protein
VTDPDPYVRERLTWPPPPPPRREHDVVIAIAIFAIGAVGFMFGWLFRRNGGLGGQPSAGGTGGNVTNIWNVTTPPPGLPAAVNRALEGAVGGAALAGPPAQPAAPPTPIPVNVVARVAPISSVNHDTHFRTLNIGTQPTVVYTAPPERYYTLQIRAVSPPGSFVYVGPNAATLAAAGTSGGNVLVIPVGAWNTVRVRPQQSIYAQGNVANTVVSMTASPEVLPSGDETL